MEDAPASAESATGRGRSRRTTGTATRRVSEMGANSITLHCNLTRDPEQIGTTGCKMRVANNQREKSKSGEWEDRANYFDVVIFGGRADACLKHLSKGSEVVVLGRLRWSEYLDKTTDKKRESISMVKG